MSNEDVTSVARCPPVATMSASKHMIVRLLPWRIWPPRDPGSHESSLQRRPEARHVHCRLLRARQNPHNLTTASPHRAAPTPLSYFASTAYAGNRAGRRARLSSCQASATAAVAPDISNRASGPMRSAAGMFCPDAPATCGCHAESPFCEGEAEHILSALIGKGPDW